MGLGYQTKQGKAGPPEHLGVSRGTEPQDWTGQDRINHTRARTIEQNPWVNTQGQKTLDRQDQGHRIRHTGGFSGPQDVGC